MGKLTGKYAVVTGAGKGIGACIVKRFLEDDVAGVAVLEYDPALCEEVNRSVDPERGRVKAIPCDVSKSDQVNAVIADVLALFGRIDILVNNAGITADKMFHKMPESNWERVMNVNLGGVYNLCKAVYPVMREQNYGKIVNVASTSGFGNAGQANYAASKAAIVGFTKTLAKEGGLKNITANSVAPGFINTDMFRAVPEEIIAEYLKQIPLKRLADPSEVASVIAFLSCDDSSFVSGQNIIISGGAHT